MVDDDTKLWSARKDAIAHKLLAILAESPRDLIVQGIRYKVEMRTYEDGPRYDGEGAFGIILVSSDDEHFDFALALDGWGTKRSMDPDESGDEW